MLRLIERGHLRVGHRLDALADLLELVGLRGHVLLLGRFRQEHVGDDRVERGAAAVVQLLRRVGLGRRIIGSPAIVELLRGDRPVADARRVLRLLRGCG